VSANARTSRAVAEVQVASASAAAEFEALHAAMFTPEMRADGEAKLAWVRVRKAWRTVQADLELVRRAIGWTSADPLTLFLAVVQQPRETLMTELFPDARRRATHSAENKALAEKKRCEEKEMRDRLTRSRLVKREKKEGIAKQYKKRIEALAVRYPEWNAAEILLEIRRDHGYDDDDEKVQDLPSLNLIRMLAKEKRKPQGKRPRSRTL
jgi:hypothetical protein